MLSSTSIRRIPRWLAVTLALLLAMVFLPVSGPQRAAAATTQISLEGCRVSAGEVLATNNGTFVCPDAEYTTGNLGKNWAELDLVPYRLTVTGSGTVQLAIAADYQAVIQNVVVTGYDVITAPVPGTSSPTGCRVSTKNQAYTPAGSNGVSATTYRLLTIDLPASGGTCLFDYNLRLALGSHNFPGSSLHASILSASDVDPTAPSTSFGNGNRDVPIPVRDIQPQQLSKTMSASSGGTYAWTVSKSAAPVDLGFPNTCSANGSVSQQVTFTVNWTRSEVTPNGEVQLSSVVTAVNPSHRDITVAVTDSMYSGTTATNASFLATENDSGVVIHAGASHDFHFTWTGQSNDTSFNDVATATYDDLLTKAPIPETTQASASATLSGTTSVSGASATISDNESLSGGSGFSYSVDSVTPSGASPAGGTFTQGNSPYTLGSATTDSVAWTSPSIAPSGTGASSGSYTFTKTVYASSGTSGSSTLSDSASLTPAGESAVGPATASVAISAAAADPMLAFKKTVDVAPTSPATFTFSVWLKDSSGAETGNPYTFDVVIPSGQTSATGTPEPIAPSTYGYVYSETPAAGYTGTGGTIQALASCASYTETVANTRDMGSVTIEKVMSGPVAGASTDFTAHLACSDPAYDQDVSLTQGNNWSATVSVPTGLSCTVTETSIPTGWSLSSISPSGQFTVQGSGEVGAYVIITNTRTVVPPPPPPGTAGLTITKAVSPVETANVNYGDTLTYTMTVTATGTLGQSNVTVTDYVPGYDSARSGSGLTTYKGDAACDGTCTVSYDSTSHLITWNLGSMSPGQVRTVTFSVTIDTPAKAADGSIPSEEILNAAAVGSTQVSTLPSNEVKNVVTAVQGVKIVKPSSGPTAAALPKTGPSAPIAPLAATAILLLGIGVGLTVAARRRTE